MNSSHDLLRGLLTESPTAPSSVSTATDSYAVLVREAGLPFRPNYSNIDPFDEWLSLMEVVQMLCPEGPARDRPMLGKKWRL